MKNIAAFAVVLSMVPVSPAWAGVVAVPGPEAGVGIGALAALGAAYAWMRFRTDRK